MKERTKSGKRYITINFMSRQRVTFMRPESTACQISTAVKQCVTALEEEWQSPLESIE